MGRAQRWAPLPIPSPMGRENPLQHPTLIDPCSFCARVPTFKLLLTPLSCTQAHLTSFRCEIYGKYTVKIRREIAAEEKSWAITETFGNADIIIDAGTFLTPIACNETAVTFHTMLLFVTPGFRIRIRNMIQTTMTTRPTAAFCKQTWLLLRTDAERSSCNHKTTVLFLLSCFNTFMYFILPLFTFFCPVAPTFG